MAPTTTRAWILANKPTNLPIVSGVSRESDDNDDKPTFKLTDLPLPPLQDGQVLLKVLHISNDPAQRLWISAKIQKNRLYTDPVEVGDVMASTVAVAEVVESRSTANLPVGTLVSGMFGWREYAVVPAEACMVIKTVPGLTPTDCVTLFGVPGVTAYYGLVDILQAGPKDAIVISGAAGAVGSTAVQIAKNILKCRKVIGIAGTDAKCKWVESLGADVCLNYKSEAFEDALKKETEGFVEAFFDNTGGPTLDLMLTLLKQDGRVAACGAMAEYNLHDPVGIKNWYHVIAMRLQIRGMVVLDAIATGRWNEITDALIQGYQDGKVKATEQGTTIVPGKFDDVPKIWMRLFSGQSSGKLLTQLV